jgi:hypothetical protein
MSIFASFLDYRYSGLALCDFHPFCLVLMSFGAVFFLFCFFVAVCNPISGDLA